MYFLNCFCLFTLDAGAERAGGVEIEKELVGDASIRGQAGSETQRRELLVRVIVLSKG
jgi:hypothetical protein